MSKFDTNATKALEVTINDKSIFTPSATNVQTGFRRAELMAASNSGTDPSTSGIKTIHFSVMKDEKKALNTSHEYQLFFLESNDYSTNQVALKYGTIIGGSSGANPDTLFLVGNVNSSPVKTIYSTRFTAGVWHNFGITLDFSKGSLLPPLHIWENADMKSERRRCITPKAKMHWRLQEQRSPIMWQDRASITLGY
jgi:Glycoside hydrolase 131 catalytic N-terminal domain